VVDMSIKRINEFPEGSGSLSSDDIFLIMDDPSGASLTKSVSLSGIQTSMKIVQSDTSLVSNSVKVTNIVSISQTNYNSLATKNSNTLYIIND
jgi:hypothetical protein